MALIIPYSFIPGTKAKSAEVNANFNAVKLFVDGIENVQEEHNIDIATLKAGKADVNGSVNERFRVADPVSSKDAINKSYLTDSIWNTVEVIRGLRCTKVDDMSYSVGQGGCYDSKGEQLMHLDNTTTKQETQLVAETTYYIFLVTDEDDNAVIASSLSKYVPDVPIGFKYFRNIGYFKTDANAKINLVYSGDYQEQTPQVVQVWRDGLRWARLWSNNMLEQWGVMNYTVGSGTKNIFLKPYDNTNYVVVTAAAKAPITHRASDGFYIDGQLGKYPDGNNNNITYYACGFIK